MNRPNPFDPLEVAEHEKRQKEIDDDVRFWFREIFAWSQSWNARNFDTHFVDSLFEQYEKFGALSVKQIEALEKIYQLWVDP